MDSIYRQAVETSAYYSCRAALSSSREEVEQLRLVLSRSVSYQSVVDISDKVTRFLWWVLPFLPHLFTLSVLLVWTWRLMGVLARRWRVWRVSSDAISFERMVPGSELVQIAPGSVPSFQAMVYVGDNPRFSGWSVLLDGFLVFPQHLFQDLGRVMVRRGKETLEVTKDRLLEILPDLVAVDLAPSEQSRLGLRKAKVGVVSGPIFSSIVGTDKLMKTMGEVRPSTFGKVQYRGSTLRGFSGSPYVIGKSVLGVHLGSFGMDCNQGYEAAYIQGVLDSLRRNESSEDYYLEQLAQASSKGQRYQFSYSPYGRDEVQVRIGGKYHMLDVEDITTEMWSMMDEYHVTMESALAPPMTPRTGGRMPPKTKRADLESAIIDDEPVAWVAPAAKPKAETPRPQPIATPRTKPPVYSETSPFLGIPPVAVSRCGTATGLHVALPPSGPSSQTRTTPSAQNAKTSQVGMTRRERTDAQLLEVFSGMPGVLEKLKDKQILRLIQRWGSYELPSQPSSSAPVEE